MYSWNPAIDYDKLINYREYYWMPDGPGAIEIDSVGPSAVAEYIVRSENLAQARLRTSPTGKTKTILYLTLYRGNTYKFNVERQRTSVLDNDRAIQEQG